MVMIFRFKGIVLILWCFLLITPSLYSQETNEKEISVNQKTYNLYPQTLDRLPDIPSPFITEDGTEIVVAFTKYKKYVLIPVTLANTPRKGKQLEIDSEDFPALDRTGLHSEIELDQTKTITKRSISEITEIGRPERSSTAGFMSKDEDIISVLKGDNRLVKKLGLFHPQLAKPLFHVWNMILKDLELDRWPPHKPWDNFEYILYNNKRVLLKAYGTKGGQGSIFQDEIEGAVDIYISRELNQKEKDFLNKKYAHLDDQQMEELVEKLSHIHTGEMEPYYVMRYGFYEGHTDYRVDPIAISFVFGLKSLKEIEDAFKGKLDKVLTEHFTKESILLGE